jgi:hypothetical protein
MFFTRIAPPPPSSAEVTHPVNEQPLTVRVDPLGGSCKETQIAPPRTLDVLTHVQFKNVSFPARLRNK